MEDFEFLSDAEISDKDDTVFQVLQHCSGALLHEHPRGNMGAWGNCILMPFYTGRKETVIEGTKPVSTALIALLKVIASYLTKMETLTNQD